MVKVVWTPTPPQISFVLTNKTDHSIEIIWDGAAFVDEQGGSHRVIHSGVRYIDRNNSQSPSVVVRKGTITDLVIPTDYIYYVAGEYGGWREESLFPDHGPPRPLARTSREFEEFRAKVERYIGKNIQILLPLRIEGVVNDYIFTFEVRNVEIK